MAKVSSFLLPEDPDKREVAWTEQPPFDRVGTMDAAVAEALLRQILDLRRQAMRGGAKDRDAAVAEAITAVRHLVEGVAGWALHASITSSIAAGDRYHQMPVWMRRDALRRSLTAVPGLPAGQRAEIVTALDALEDGVVEPILQKGKPRRHGRKPRERPAAQLDILMWIQWQVGLGRTADSARTEAAQALGLTTKALEKWSSSDDVKSDYVRQLLVGAKSVGRAERLGEDCPDASLREHFHSWPLSELAARCRETAQRRKIVKEK